MSWYYWALVVWLGVEAAGNVLTVGRPRDPRTPLEALVACVFFGAVAWAIVSLGAA